MATTGIRYFEGINNIFEKYLTSGMFKINKTIFPMNNAAINPHTTSGFCLNNRGPGVTSRVINIANKTAVVPEPGTPSASIGTKAPPAAALFPASGAATPLSSPFPKVSFLLEIFFSNV